MTCKKWKQFFLGLFWLDLFQFVVLLFLHFDQDDQQKYEQLVCLPILWEIYPRFMSEQSSSFISVMLYLRFIVVLFG